MCRRPVRVKTTSPSLTSTDKNGMSNFISARPTFYCAPAPLKEIVFFFLARSAEINAEVVLSGY